MSPRHVRLGIFGSVWPQKVNEGGWEANTEQLLIRRIESKMKEFDTNFVERLLEGAKTNVRSTTSRS